ncbi:MAG: NADH:ubiquinone reductase (Na(+)-transporting) subunit C [Planctomycetota bacterium]
MDKNSNQFTLLFAIAMCVVLATALASTFHGLKPTIDKNKLFDKNRNVLIAVGLYDPEKGPKTQMELETLFAEKVKIQILEFTKGNVFKDVKEGGEPKTVQVREVVKVEKTDHKIEDLIKLRRELRQKGDRDHEYDAVYVADTPAGTVYCVPISGPGLWSILYGFLALKDDLNTVVGITFYQHGETPGLGGEVEKSWWREDWKGKKILEDGRLVSITVLRGRGNPNRGPHEVDGISGSTITCNGVARFIKEDLQNFELYFKQLRKN